MKLGHLNDFDPNYINVNLERLRSGIQKPRYTRDEIGKIKKGLQVRNESVTLVKRRLTTL
jgi:hypothetical protein